MKKASNVKLSLRKLFIAMLAAAPVAILPSPVLAVLPTNLTTTTSFDTTQLSPGGVGNPAAGAPWGVIVQTAGSGNLAVSGNVANINVSDKSVLVWSKGSFNIATGETYNFNFNPSGGSVLNKVGYYTNGTVHALTDDVTINGGLNSNGRVFILANGNITVSSPGGSNSIDTSGGLYLSTVQETSDFNFTSLGALTSNGNNRGNITLGGATPVAVSRGGIEAVSGNSIVVGGANITSGDLIVRTIGAGNGITLASASGVVVTNGNLVVSTNNAVINQTNSISVAAAGKSASFTSGTGNISLTGSSDFPVLNVSANNATVLVTDSNSVTLGNVGVGSNGNLTVVASAGSIDNTQPITSGNVTLNASGNLTLTGANTPNQLASTTGGAISVNLASSSSTLNTLAAAGNVTVTSTGALALNGTVGTGTSSNITLTGTSITAASAGNINGSIGTTNVSLNATAGGVTLANVTARALNVKANNGSISQVGANVITTAGNVAQTFDAGSTGSIMLTNNNMFGQDAMLNLVGGTVSVTNNSASRLIISSVNTTGSLTINATQTISTNNTTNVLLGSGSGTNAGSITVGGGLTINTYGTLVTINSTRADYFGGVEDDDDLTLRVFGPVVFNTTATLGSTGSHVVLDSAIGAAGRGSSSLGQISATLGNATLAVHENQSLSFGTVTVGAVTANSVSGNILIGGSFTASGNVSMNANTGGISQTAPISLTSTNANHSFRSSNSSATILDNPSNNFAHTAGNVQIINGGNNIVNANSGFRLGNGTTNNLTLTTTSTTANVVLVQNNGTNGVGGNNIVINSASPIEVQTTSAIRNLTLNTTNTSSSSIVSASAGNLQVNGTLTLTSLGNVTLIGSANITNTTTGSGAGMNVTGTVLLSNIAGDTTLINQRNLTLAGSATQSNVTAVAGYGPFANTWNLNLGNLNVRSLTANVVNGEFNGGPNPVFAGQSGNIQQLANTNVHVETDATFITFNGGNIVVGNNGNSFGRVNAYTRGSVGVSHTDLVTGSPIANGNVTIVEDGTLKTGNIITAGTASLTSRFGSVIEDTTLGLTLNVGTLSASSVNGSILLGGTTNGNTTGGTIGAFNVTAPSGAVAIQSAGNVTLGATAANSLSVRSGNSISQNGALNIFGAATFNAANAITLNDSANNFGPVTLVSGNAASGIVITEANTLNLRNVTVPGGGNSTFTATSVNGSIIDTGLGGVRPGGAVGTNGNGVVSLNAINGDIVIDDPTSDFPTSGGVAFNAKNVTLSVLGSGTPTTTLVLGAIGTTSVATGNFTATSALGNISNAGALNVTGTAVVQAGAGSVFLNNAGNQFGSIRFNGLQVNIVEANDTVLLTGSSSVGSASIQSYGNLTVSNAQGGNVISFGGTASLSATGTIILPKLIQAAGTLTVSAPGVRDLGALSLSSDLSGISPNWAPSGFVTGRDVAPQP